MLHERPGRRLGQFTNIHGTDGATCRIVRECTSPTPYSKSELSENAEEHNLEPFATPRTPFAPRSSASQGEAAPIRPNTKIKAFIDTRRQYCSRSLGVTASRLKAV